MKKHITIRLIIILLALLFVRGGINTHAQIQIFSDIQALYNGYGANEYLESKYLDNYSFDIVKLSFLENFYVIFNFGSNVLLYIVRSLGYLVVSLFYHAMNFDLSVLLGSSISDVQKALDSNIFKTFFIFAFSAAAAGIAKKFAKRDAMGILGDFVRVVCLFLMSGLIVTHSATVLSSATKITKSIGVSALTSINDIKHDDVSSEIPNPVDDNIENYSAVAAGKIWESLVHEPWKMLQFDGLGDVDDGTVKEFLKKSPGSDERATLVEEYAEENENAFSKELTVKRISFMIVYLFPFLIKSGIYLFVSVFQIALQLMALLYVLLAPIILLLAMLPSFGGFDIVSVWLKKILESQLNILIMTFIIGLIIKIDNLIFSMAEHFGWFVVIFLQTIIALIIMLKHNELFKIAGNISRGMRSPATAKNMIRSSGNAFHMAHRSSAGLNKITRKIPSVPTVVKGMGNAADKMMDAQIALEKGVVGGVKSSVVGRFVTRAYKNRFSPQGSGEFNNNTGLPSAEDNNKTDSANRSGSVVGNNIAQKRVNIQNARPKSMSHTEADSASGNKRLKLIRSSKTGELEHGNSMSAKDRAAAGKAVQSNQNISERHEEESTRQEQTNMPERPVSRRTRFKPLDNNKPSDAHENVSESKIDAYYVYLDGQAASTIKDSSDKHRENSKAAKTPAKKTASAKIEKKASNITERKLASAPRSTPLRADTVSSAPVPRKESVSKNSVAIEKQTRASSKQKPDASNKNNGLAPVKSSRSSRASFSLSGLRNSKKLSLSKRDMNKSSGAVNKKR